jgi:transposase
MELRELKALEIAARARVTFEDGAWRVPSQSGHGAYRVTLGPAPQCACDDFQLRQQPCKHILAARLVAAREGGERVPTRPTYRQDWPRYNEAQTTEKHRFRVLLADLCRGVPQLPRQGRSGRLPGATCDMVFACAFKVYAAVSSRRFMGDLDDAHRQGYLTRPVHYNSINGYLEDPRLTPILRDLIGQSSRPLRAVESVFAPDSTGFSTSRFVRWYDEKYGAERSGHDWVKAHAMCGVKTNIVTAVEVHGRNAADAPQFGPLVEATAQHFVVKEVPADKAYLSQANLELVAGLGGTAYIPFKANSAPGEAGSVWEKMYLYYSLRREEFLAHYHQRSNVESTFAMVKAKFRDHVRSRSDTAMTNEVLCRFLCHNICVVHQSHIELGIAPLFWGAAPAAPEAAPLGEAG